MSLIRFRFLGVMASAILAAAVISLISQPTCASTTSIEGPATGGFTVSLSPDEKKPSSVLDFTVKDIEGKSVKLNKFKGKTLLIVNVASFCGNTPQYKSMQALYEKYKSKGFEV